VPLAAGTPLVAVACAAQNDANASGVIGAATN